MAVDWVGGYLEKCELCEFGRVLTHSMLVTAQKKCEKCEFALTKMRKMRIYFNTIIYLI